MDENSRAILADKEQLSRIKVLAYRLQLAANTARLLPANAPVQEQEAALQKLANAMAPFLRSRVYMAVVVDAASDIQPTSPPPKTIERAYHA